MSSLRTDVSSMPPPKIFWLLMVVGIILASEIASIGFIVSISQTIVDWLPFMIAAAPAGLLAGLPCWRLYIVKPRNATIARGIAGGVFSGIIAHPFMWIFIALFTPFMITNDPGHRTILETTQDIIMYSMLSLIYFGWITAAVGGAAGALLIYLQREMTRWTRQQDIPT